MKDSPVFLAAEHILAIHRRMIEEFGGDPGVRDGGLLESAAMMPQSAFGGRYLHGDLPAMAAAYLFHICRNHAFVDGNKRTALASAEVFLRLNGHRLAASNKDLERIMSAVADGTMGKEDLTAFFRSHVKRSLSDAPEDRL